MNHPPPNSNQLPPCCQGHATQHADPEKNPFLVPLIWISVFTVVEFAGGMYTHSLALLSDAWHMLSDVLAIALAMWAAHQARHGQQGKRMELWVSLFNAVLMLVVTAWIIWEAITRLSAPQAVYGGVVTMVALVGLGVNVVVAKKMHQHHHHGAEDNLNHRAAFLHVIGDLLGSVVAVIAGVVIYLTGWMAIDPILSILISLLLLVVTANLLRDIQRGFAGHAHAHDHH